ncbi:SWI:SNF matrix associated [Fasciola hepatica]|uniref:SWI:SNF matrix associated n=1 Tax=Fasciola hepatica TaxID=6192 RepID=A0A4E0RVC4_FASHE|nr:SWI:SNF matrix associated [Fasciola hepatica]
MGDDALTDEQRALIEAKRRKAMENRIRNNFQLSDSSKSRGNAPSMQPKYQQGESVKVLKQSVIAPQTSAPCKLPLRNPYPASVHPSAPSASVNHRPPLGAPFRADWKPMPIKLDTKLDPKSSVLMPPSSFNVPSVNVTCSLVSETMFEVHARYHTGLSELYKSLPTRQYDSKTRKWSFALSDYNEFVKRAKLMPGIVVDGLPSVVLKIFKGSLSSGLAKPKESQKPKVILSDYLPDDMINYLLPFQREGVSLALARKGRVLLADDMGLGKTIQSLALAVAYRSDWPLLIVTPSSVRFAWRDQCLRWLSGPLQITANDILVVTTGRDLENVNRYTANLITLMSYDLMARFSTQIELCRFGMVIMDESHFLKNIKAARTKAALQVVKNAKRVILLSGTPAVSRPAELYPQIQAVSPTIFRGGFHEFGLRYCAAKECPWGWDYSGCSNMVELQLLLESSVMIRRTKADVLHQLPPKRRELVVLDPSIIRSTRLKRHAKAMASTGLSSEQKKSAMLEYFHETGSVKIAALRQYILDLVEVGRKFLLYAHHTEVLDALSNTLSEKSVDHIRIDGRTNSEQRSVVCKKFQQEENCRVALLSITAAGTGLNLTSANLVVFGELFWNPGALVQAEDRVYRIGQKDSVVVRYLIAEGTVDDYIWPLIERKLQVLSSAGLNRETFRTADTTRLGPAQPEQQSILDFVEHTFVDDTDLGNIPVDASPVFELDWDRTKVTEPPTKRGRVTNLFDQTTSELQDEPVCLAPDRLLVAATPETSPEKSDLCREAVDKTVSGAQNDATVINLEEDDTFLLEAAEAAEVAWLTEGLLTEEDAE